MVFDKWVVSYWGFGFGLCLRNSEKHLLGNENLGGGVFCQILFELLWSTLRITRKFKSLRSLKWLTHSIPVDWICGCLYMYIPFMLSKTSCLKQGEKLFWFVVDGSISDQVEKDCYLCDTRIWTSSVISVLCRIWTNVHLSCTVWDLGMWDWKCCFQIRSSHTSWVPSS